ncbi:MAG: hypothetical protein NTX20_02800 [Verrucomicrobia bacterium]|nr:hypothetical protein [Verrucomicrobiota bacterium]
MTPFVRIVLALAALSQLPSASGQVFIFKSNERWEINDPFKMDRTALSPKQLVDAKKGLINPVNGTVERTNFISGAEIRASKKLVDVLGIIWPLPERLIEAQNNINRGEPGKALDNIEAVIKLFEPLKTIPGSWWAKATMLKLDALDRLENEAAIGSFLDNLEKDESAKLPELAIKIQLARLMQRARKGDHEAVIKEATDLIPKMDDPDLLARLHIVKANSLLATKKYELAMNVYLRVPVFYGAQLEHVPKALLGAARAFRGMDAPATREQKLEEVSNRYLRDIITTYPVSKEAEEAKKLLPKEDRVKAEAEQKKLATAAALPEGAVMAKPKVKAEDDQSGNK